MILKSGLTSTEEDASRNQTEIDALSKKRVIAVAIVAEDSEWGAYSSGTVSMKN
jgi:hypothetical protein